VREGGGNGKRGRGMEGMTIFCASTIHIEFLTNVQSPNF